MKEVSYIIKNNRKLDKAVWAIPSDKIANKSLHKKDLLILEKN